MDFTVIVTLGPSILNHTGRLEEIHALGRCIFRMNGAHLTAPQASETIRACRRMIPEIELMIDLPGNKIRTGSLEQPIRFTKDERFNLRPTQLNLPDFGAYLKPGDQILACDSIYTFDVEEASADGITIRSRSDGELLSNKGMHVRGVNKTLPFLFQRDLELIDLAATERVEFLSLSYVRDENDILEVAKSVGAGGPHLIAKIETSDAIGNLAGIFGAVDTVNVDRGDLSTDIGLMRVASTQDSLVKSALRAGKTIFLATQFLKNMERNPVPLIAEIVDLHRTIVSGVHGIQLSEETAVGRHPVECVGLVFEAYRSSFSV